MNFKHYRGYTIKVEKVAETAVMFFSDFEFNSHIEEYVFGETPNTFKSVEELKTYIDEENMYFLPLYSYKRSAKAISTVPVNPEIDEVIGYVFISKEEISRDPRLSEANLKEYAENLMNKEVEYFNLYLTGEEYVIDIYKGELSEEQLEDADDVEDGCQGFIGVLEACFNEGKSMVDNHIKVKETKNV